MHTVPFSSCNDEVQNIMLARKLASILGFMLVYVNGAMIKVIAWVVTTATIIILDISLEMRGISL